jgi:hypothetical protein
VRAALASAFSDVFHSWQKTGPRFGVQAARLPIVAKAANLFFIRNGIIGLHLCCDYLLVLLQERFCPCDQAEQTAQQ